MSEPEPLTREQLERGRGTFTLSRLRLTDTALAYLDRAEARERERDELFVQAVGWTWAEACSRVERGEDIRNVLIPRIFEGARDALRAQEPKHD